MMWGGDICLPMSVPNVISIETAKLAIDAHNAL